ncbi:MAG: carbonic anhydrase [Nitrospirae bacterium]|nr:carbonic anhydrase [Nitrospirota bacterium]MBI5695314.1 carbonic anhydrase [Nitrospirota bacterium]
MAVTAYAGDAATKLMDGNKRFASGELCKKDLCKEKRDELTKGQHPFATILTCSDSRVSPEILFDQGLGDVFIVRVAGNVVDEIALGSIEYGVEHLHTPLLVILGHQSCGAVKATLELTGEPEGNIGAILKKIQPAVATAKASGKTDSGELLNDAIQQNVRNVYDDIMKNSEIVKELVHEGKLEVVTAEYYLGTGEVKLLDAAKAEHAGHGHEASH